MILMSALMLVSCDVKDSDPDLGTLPEVTTFAPGNITTHSAESGGVITNEGGTKITLRGLYWGTEPEPDQNANTATEGIGGGMFVIQLSGLEPNRTYYARAFAQNTAGIGIGNEVSFTTLALPAVPGGGVTDVDGNQYASFIIGGMEWMASNLRATKYRNGTAIPNLTNGADWMNTTTGAYVWYGNDQQANADRYGALYNWHAVETGNLCPDGWRIPTDNDFMVLEGTADSKYDQGHSIWTEFNFRGHDAGHKLKSTSGWYLNRNGVNDFGFNAMPGGYRWINGSFESGGQGGTWWNSTEHSSNETRTRSIGHNHDKVYRGNANKQIGFSVRCVKD